MWRDGQTVAEWVARRVAPTPSSEPVVVAAIATLEVVAVVAGAGVVASAPAAAAGSTPVDSCTTITEPGAYVLTTDIRTTAVDDYPLEGCITIGTDDVVFDGGGHTIDGVDYSDGYGVHASERDNVTIRDVTVTGWLIGIRYRGADGRIAGVTSVDNDVEGVRIAYASNTTIVDSTIRGSGDGLHLLDVHYSVVENNTIADTTDRGVLVEGVGNRIVDNTLRSAGNRSGYARSGVTLYSGGDNTVSNNSISRSDHAGIRAMGGGNNTIVGNDVRASRKGVVIERRSHNNTVSGNTVVGNDDSGLAVFTSGNTIADNVASENTDGIVLFRGGNDGLAPEGVGNDVVENTVAGNREVGIVVARGNNSVVGNEVDDHRIGIAVDASEGWRIPQRSVADPIDNELQGNAVRNNTFGVQVARAEIRHAGTTRTYAAADNLLADTVARGNQVDGIKLIATNGTRLTDTESVENRYGIHVLGSRDVTIEGSTADRNALDGIRVAAEDAHGRGADVASNVSVVRTVARSNGANGIRVDNATAVTVANNTVANNAFGISLWSSRNATVSGTEAVGNAHDGVRLFSTNETVVEDTVARANRYGVRAIASSDVTIVDAVADHNDLDGVRLDDEDWKGNGAGPSTGHRLGNVTVASNGAAGVRLDDTNDAALTDVAATANRYGLWMTGSSHNDVAGATVESSLYWAILTEDGAENNQASALDLGGNATVSFTGTDVALGPEETPPTPPDGYANAGGFVRVSTRSSNAEARINVSYTDAEVAAAGIDERTLRLWRHDGSWSQVAGENDVNMDANETYATVSTAGTFAPLGEQNETDTQPAMSAGAPPVARAEP